MILAAAGATWMLTWADSYVMYLIAALGIGLAGGSFIIGVAYVSRLVSRRGIKARRLACSVRAMSARRSPSSSLPSSWWPMAGTAWPMSGLSRWRSWACCSSVFAKDDPELVERRKTGAKAPSLAEQFAPLKNLQVWRFSLYYFFVFGAFVALALWTAALPDRRL